MLRMGFRMIRLLARCTVLAVLFAQPSPAAESLPLQGDRPPQTADELWAGYDPSVEPLEIQIVRQWNEDGIIYRYVVYTIGTFKGRKVRMAAFYGFPADAADRKLPAVMHMHGGGQRAPDTPLAHRRPGYPLTGCVPAEPASVSPGATILPCDSTAMQIPLDTVARPRKS